MGNAAGIVDQDRAISNRWGRDGENQGGGKPED
jgi:hypothetical protein